MKYNQKFMKFIYLNSMSRIPITGWTMFINHHCKECGTVHEIARSKFEWAKNKFGDNPMMVGKTVHICSPNITKANEMILRHGKTGMEITGTVGTGLSDVRVGYLVNNVEARIDVSLDYVQ